MRSIHVFSRRAP
uniref:Uncharacterized protein n=1 Tax=Anguilla anguilla TaxID=7936 RepID=A0A0E9TAI0_ANGAN